MRFMTVAQVMEDLKQQCDPKFVVKGQKGDGSLRQTSWQT
jgi:hypothetical protein